MEDFEKIAKFTKAMADVFPDGTHGATVLTVLQHFTAAVLNDFGVPTEVFLERVEHSRAVVLAAAAARQRS